MSRYSTIQQHEALRVPNVWGSQEKRFVAQLEEAFDDIYRRFGRLKLSDLGSELRELVVDSIRASELEAEVGAFGYLKANQLESEVAEFGYLKTSELDTEVLKTSTIVGINGELVLKASREELSDLETNVTVAVDGMRVTIQEGDKTVSELRATVEGLDHWVTDADGNVSELTNTVRGLESVVATVDGKVSTLSNTVDGLRSTIQQGDETLSELSHTAEGLNQWVTDSEGTVARLTNTILGMNSTVTTVDGKVSTLSNTVDGLSATVENLNTNTSSRFDVIAGAIGLETQADGNQVSVRLNAMEGRIDLKADETYVDGLIAKCVQTEYFNAQLASVRGLFASYIKTEDLKSQIGAINELTTKRLGVNGYFHAYGDAGFDGAVNIDGTLSVIFGVSTQALTTNALTLEDTAASWQSGTFITGVTLPDYEPTFKTINYVSYVNGAATSNQITVMTGITKKEAGSVDKSTINYVGA